MDDMSEDGHIESWGRETVVVTINIYIALCQGTTPMRGIWWGPSPYRCCLVCGRSISWRKRIGGKNRVDMGGVF